MEIALSAMLPFTKHVLVSLLSQSVVPLSIISVDSTSNTIQIFYPYHKFTSLLNKKLHVEPPKALIPK